MKISNIFSISSAAVLALIGLAAPALATNYHFTYNYVDSGQSTNGALFYGSSGVISGDFTGTGPLNNIAVDSVSTLYINGTPFSGPYSLGHYEQVNGVNSDHIVSGGAVISNDSSATNFFFSNANGAYFYIIQPWYNPNGQVLATGAGDGMGHAIDYYNGQFVAANFSVAASAPEPATWAMMGLGFACLAMAGYRHSRNTAPMA